MGSFKLVLKFLVLVSSVAANAVNIDLSCHGRIGGTWNFGSAPMACDVQPLANKAVLATEYAPVIFSDRASSSDRKIYMSALYPILRDVGTEYLKRRNPSVGDTEVEGFLTALFALAEQETYWTHFRLGSDQLLRYMRGDSLHGHGLMQIDDRSHVQALREGKGVDLVYNLMYGLDIFYAAWVESRSAHCVSSSDNYHDRARAAWAAYNGGPGSVCRWTRNLGADRDFNLRLNSQAWRQWVNDPNATSPIDIKCLMFGQRPCSPRLISTVPAVAMDEKIDSPETTVFDIDPTHIMDMAAMTDNIQKLIECHLTGCLGQTTSNDEFYEIGRQIEGRLNSLAMRVQLYPLSNTDLNPLAQTFLSTENGWVSEAALHLMSTQPKSEPSFLALIQLLQSSSDDQLVAPLLAELKRYNSPEETRLLDEAIVEVLRTGPPFFAEALAKSVGTLITPSNRPMFKAALQHFADEPDVVRPLQRSMSQSDR